MSTATTQEATRLTGGAAAVMHSAAAAPASGPTGGDLAPGVPAGADVDQPAHAAPSSPLRTLRQAIAEAEAEEPLHLDAEVPRMRGVVVRYRPVGSVEYAQLEKRVNDASRIKPDRKLLMLNAMVLATACLGVYVVDDDGTPQGEPEEWVRPGPDLARELGKSEAEMPTAAETMLGLYRTEGDLMAMGLELVQWSATDSAKREPVDLGG